MILQNEEQNFSRGSLPVGKGNHWGTLPVGIDSYMLTASANDPSGTGLTWAPITTAFPGPIGVNGAAPPAQAASPGVAAGTDAAVINAIVAVLKNLGFTQ